MWTYNKMLQYPINIKNRNPQMAKVIISQYGGPDGELCNAKSNCEGNA
jgi:spore coat protein JC